MSTTALAQSPIEQRSAVGGPPARPPFFIVGAQRSGTTLFRLMLNEHPELSVPFESVFIPVFYRRLHEYGDLAQRDNARRLLSDMAAYPLHFGRLVKDPDAILAHPISSYAELLDAVFRVDAAAKKKTRWGDKTPGYETDIDVLCELFPGCQIIHLVRDGRDVVLSNRRVEWGIASLPRAAADWRWKVTLGHKMGRLLGGQYLELKYECLVLDPERSLRRACAFLDVAFDPRMLDYPAHAERDMPIEARPFHRNSIRPPDPSLIDEWRRRMSRADRIIFEQVAGDALELFGYELERHPATVGSRLKNLYYAIWRRW
jgi:Sulfotransferase family